MKHFSLKLFCLLLVVTALVSFAAPITRMRWPGAYGGPYEVAYQAVPTTLTDVDTQDVHLVGYCVYNSTAGSLNFTIQTKDGSPLALPYTGAIAANTSVCNNSPFGLLSKGGFSVLASGAGLFYGAVWTH